MDSSIEKLKNGETCKVSNLEVKVVKNVFKNWYIVADEKGNMLLDSEQCLKEGSTYKLIKPTCVNSTLKKHPKFAAIKMEKGIKAKALKDGEEDELLKKIKDDKAPTKVSNNFKLIDANGVGSLANEIKVMVVSKSSVIAGKYGDYRIVTCKDVTNQKNSINLYRNHMNMVEVGEIYSLTKIKVSNYKKEEDEFRRVGTTASSRIIRANAEDRDLFERAGVLLGDKAAKGIILGISELKSYESCMVCWCKVEDDNTCRKCNKQVENKKADFNLAMYFQAENDDDEVIDVFCFKTTLNLKDIDDIEISEENLNKKLEGKKCEIEYTIDKTREDGKVRLVKFKLNSA